MKNLFKVFILLTSSILTFTSTVISTSNAESAIDDSLHFTMTSDKNIVSYNDLIYIDVYADITSVSGSSFTCIQFAVAFDEDAVSMSYEDSISSTGLGLLNTPRKYKSHTVAVFLYTTNNLNGDVYLGKIAFRINPNYQGDEVTFTPIVGNSGYSSFGLTAPYGVKIVNATTTEPLTIKISEQLIKLSETSKYKIVSLSSDPFGDPSTYVAIENSNRQSYNPYEMNVISRILPETFMPDFLNQIDAPRNNIKIYDYYDNEVDLFDKWAYVCTGMKLVLYDDNGEILDLLYLSVYGDYGNNLLEPCGDGWIDMMDALAIVDDIVSYNFKSLLCVFSADVNLDGYLDMIDSYYLFYHMAWSVNLFEEFLGY